LSYLSADLSKITRQIAEIIE